jgi:hypothetical protein
MTAELRQIVEGVLLVFAALFPIVNPLGGAPIFVAMTSRCSPAERAALAWQVTINAFILLVAALWSAPWDGNCSRILTRSKDPHPKPWNRSARARSTR